MKDTGKTIHGVKVYSDPEVPPDQLFLLHDNFKNLPPRRSGMLTGLTEPPKKYGFLRRIKRWLWDSL